MNLKLENFFIFLWVLTDFGRSVLSFDSKCPPLRLVSGRSRYQWRGRSVRFNCMRSFQLVGVKYATCMNGKWDAEVPICVKYGCRVPSVTHVNGQFIESYRGAVVKIVCNPGYNLIGSPSVYCNGIKWNETFPVCRVTRTNPDTSCNFENEDLCGWSQDPMHDFDWKRRKFTGNVTTLTATDSGRGFYMYIENSNSRSDNDTARLFSPVYPPGYSNGTCFKFWYRMHGNTTGFLKVYVKPEGVELWNIIPSFWITGDQGNSWFQRIFTIETMKTPFQIVFEGVRGPGAMGDTAVDDVKLSQEECSVLETTSTSTESSESTINADDDIVEYVSCKNRCHEEKTNETDMDLCHCYESCDRDGTCCTDYFDLCVTFVSTPALTATTTHSDVKVSPSSSTPSTLPSIEPELNLPLPKPPPKHFNNESNEIDPGKLFPRVPPQTAPNRTSNEIHPTSRTSPKTTTPPPQPKITPFKNDTISKSTANTTKTTNRKLPKVVLAKPATNRTITLKVPANGAEVNVKVIAKNTTVSSSSSSSTSTTTARVISKPKLNNTKLTFLDKPFRPTLTDESPFIKGKPKEISGKELPQAIKIDKSSNNGGVPIKEIVEFGGTALAIFIFIVLAIFWYKRRMNQKTERDNMVEDSDSIIYEMDSSTLGSEYHSLVCIRPGGLKQSL